jgi:hypothetical protein
MSDAWWMPPALLGAEQEYRKLFAAPDHITLA